MHQKLLNRNLYNILQDYLIKHIILDAILKNRNIFTSPEQFKHISKVFFYSLIHIFEKDNVKYGHNKKEMKQEKRNRIFFYDLHVPNMWYMCPLRISLFQSQNNRIED